MISNGGFPDRIVHAANYQSYEEYKQAHALNCALLMAGILEEFGVDKDTIDDVARLVAHHESGVNTREDALKNADILSFFHVSLPLFNDRRGT